MTNEDVFQRQPRAGMGVNEARMIYNTSKAIWEVQLRNYAKDGSFYPALQFVSEWRAEQITARLNKLFEDHTADLDFITPSYIGGTYVVIWSGTTWLGKGVFTQKTIDYGETYEDLYRGCKLQKVGGGKYPYSDEEPVVIATVTTDDVQIYNNKNPWEIAFEWANTIRSCVNGWNCSKYAALINPNDGIPYLVNDGYIYVLKSVIGKYTSQRDIEASYYGVGELQPGVQTANGDIFHTLDLTVAVPTFLYNAGLVYNMWVKVTYNGSSIVARVTDRCGRNDRLDLSAGLALALGFPQNSTGVINVTISAP